MQACFIVYEKSRRLLGVVEVETTESINHLEAMSQWGAFSRLRVPFHLYVPAGSVDSARRLFTDLQMQEHIRLHLRRHRDFF